MTAPAAPHPSAPDDLTGYGAMHCHRRPPDVGLAAHVDMLLAENAELRREVEQARAREAEVMARLTQEPVAWSKPEPTGERR